MPKGVAPLSGMRIIDFTSMVAGPFGTRMLADCGAEVVKIEPLAGDYFRHRSPIRNGRSSYFGHMNCGKKSLALDLKSERGRNIARKLIATADVVVENYRPGVMHEFGLGYEDLKDEFPDLVYCSISGFGQTGSRAREPAYAPMIHAASGLDLTHMWYNKHLERPPNMSAAVADIFVAVYAFGAIQTALLNRERHGGGEHIDVALLPSALSLLVYEFQSAQFPKEEVFRPIYAPSKAKDGFVVVVPANQANFEKLMDAIGHPEFKTDARFATARGREEHWDELMAKVEEWTQERPAALCEDILMRAGVPTSRYKPVEELVADEEFRTDGTYATVTDGSGEYLVPNQPFKFSSAKVEAAGWVSDLGADRMELLRGIGLSDADIEQLGADRVIVGQ